MKNTDDSFRAGSRSRMAATTRAYLNRITSRSIPTLRWMERAPLTRLLYEHAPLCPWVNHCVPTKTNCVPLLLANYGLHFFVSDNMSIHSNMSVNTLGPSFQIDLSSLIRNSNLICNEEDSRQVANVIKRHMSALKKVREQQRVDSRNLSAYLIMKTVFFFRFTISTVDSATEIQWTTRLSCATSNSIG